jgi:D-beta-D-heptose 7-phosphate kinase/D-beta-D-heptose 1-phosphate adenosyltransferase
MDFTHLRVLCVGDVMLDRFLHGDIERISPEAPVPVIRLRETREMPGGAGNVAANVAALGGEAILIGLTGKDEAGDRLLRLLSARPGITPALVATPRRPTICKTRFIAGRQQVIRADDESAAPLFDDERDRLIAAIDARLSGIHAVVLSDYGKAALSRDIVAHAIGAARAAGLPVFVDPKSDDFRRYRGATCITPNLKEFTAAARTAGADAGSGTNALEAAAMRLLDWSEAEAILVTRSERGMTLVERSGEVHSVPARAREVFDVSGAGDTVIATLALAHAGGRSLSQAMHIANAAAGVVVSKLGTATADIAEVMHELAAQSEQLGGPAQPGLQKLQAACGLVARWREQGLTVGFTNGCFDILHPGHVSLLAAARLRCDRLVVALNSDASVRRLKGPTRPVNGLEQRAQVMAAIRFVDCVVAFEEDTPLETIRALMPDVLVKGADYSIDQVVGADLVTQAGGRVFLADLIAGQSTTGIIARATAPLPVG